MLSGTGHGSLRMALSLLLGLPLAPELWLPAGPAYVSPLERLDLKKRSFYC